MTKEAEIARVNAVVFPGSFDPLTLGHLDLLRRALNIFDEVVLAVLSNPKKATLFSLDERVALATEVCREMGGRISVQSFSGLLVDFTRQVGTKFILRGLRAISDYEYEAQMALMNRHISGDVETIFLMSREESSYISSSLVREVAVLGGDVSRFVPPVVAEALREKIKIIQGRQTA